MSIEAIKHFKKLFELKMIIFQPDGGVCWFFNHFQEFKTIEDVWEFIKPFDKGKEAPCYVFNPGIDSRDEIESIVNFLKFLGVSIEQKTEFGEDTSSVYYYEIYEVNFPEK